MKKIALVLRKGSHPVAFENITIAIRSLDMSYRGGVITNDEGAIVKVYVRKKKNITKLVATITMIDLHDSIAYL